MLQPRFSDYATTDRSGRLDWAMSAIAKSPNPSAVFVTLGNDGSDPGPGRKLESPRKTKHAFDGVSRF